jgi:hypothetical protein
MATVYEPAHSPGSDAQPQTARNLRRLTLSSKYRTISRKTMAPAPHGRYNETFDMAG